MPEYIRKLLSTAEGRELVSDALCRIIQISDSTPVKQNIDIRFITYNAGHRVVSRTLDTNNPVSLIRVDLDGFHLFLVHNGNHRIEQARQSGNTIDAMVSQSMLKKYFISADGTSFTRNENDPPWIFNPIPDSLTKVLIALNLNPTLDNRTYAA